MKFQVLLGINLFMKCYVYTYVLLYILCCRTKWVKTDGAEYKVDAGVILDVDEEDLPVVGRIRHSYVVDNTTVIFDVMKYITTYESHFRAYVLSEAEDATSPVFIYQTKLLLRSPVHVRRSQVFGTNKYIIFTTCCIHFVVTELL